MKTKILLIIFVIIITKLSAQSNITIGNSASIVVQAGADICANSVTGMISGDGTLCDSPLPVELISFDGFNTNEGVLLEWQTATEVNNYGFQVQRQKEKDKSENEWEVIGFVQGHGTTNSPNDYEYTDSDLPNSESVDYRLKQIDNDGTFAFSKVITVDLSTITNVDDEVVYEFALEQNYPNPFNPTTTIKFTVPTPPHPSPYQGEGAREGLVLLRVYDILGREVATLLNKELQPGNHEVRFDASSLSSGMYFYKINVGEHFNSVKKMLLIK